jgi:hypothetical protein
MVRTIARWQLAARGQARHQSARLNEPRTTDLLRRVREQLTA